MDEYSLARAYDAGLQHGKRDAYWRGVAIGFLISFIGLVGAAILAVL